VLDLLGNLLLADLRHGASHAEPVGTRELDLGTNLEVQLERQRFSLVELHRMDVRLTSELELFALDNLSIRLLDKGL